MRRLPTAPRVAVVTLTGALAAAVRFTSYFISNSKPCAKRASGVTAEIVSGSGSVTAMGNCMPSHGRGERLLLVAADGCDQAGTARVAADGAVFGVALRPARCSSSDCGFTSAGAVMVSDATALLRPGVSFLKFCAAASTGTCPPATLESFGKIRDAHAHFAGVAAPLDQHADARRAARRHIHERRDQVGHEIRMLVLRFQTVAVGVAAAAQQVFHATA